MKFPRLAKLGRSDPMRCAMNAACFLSSFLDEHSCPMKSWARMSPAKSKKNRFMIAQPSGDRSVPAIAASHFWDGAFKSRTVAEIGAALAEACRRLTSIAQAAAEAHPC